MKIFIHDEFNPQDVAMMQALYSRSAASVEEHVTKVRETGSGKFMERYYVGYGHASIADCGSTTVFIEGVSILADKAIQDWPLYSGQETSSRYIDMSHQPLVDPIGTAGSHAILDRWLDFYTTNQPAVAAEIKRRYPRREGENEAVYERAVAARTFDSLRGFLPAGITTQLSWHTNLRQAADKLALLRHHPLAEVQSIARAILTALKEKYPQSFSHEWTAEQESYRAQAAAETYFNAPRPPDDFQARTTIAPADLEPYRALLSARPPKTNVPIFLAELGTVSFDFMLDYGSFRDIQRHRHGVCRMPLLTTAFGFESWYLDQLPESLRESARQLIAEQTAAIDALEVDPTVRQYYTALGFLVHSRVTYGLPATVYVVELRSGRLVHPTLRRLAHRMYRYLTDQFPTLVLHADLDPDDWDVRRGLQDIQEKL